MSLSIQRADYRYLERPRKQAGPSRIHAVEMGEMGLWPHTLCGVAWDETWTMVKASADICGVCDKAIRSRIREAREAEVANMLRSAGEGHALTLMRETLLGLSEAYGLALAARDAAERALLQIQAIRRTIFLLVHGQKPEEGEESHG